MLLNADMSKVMILRDVSWQTQAVIEPFVPYFYVVLLWCGSFLHPDGCLCIGYRSKDTAVGAHRGPCSKDSVSSMLNLQ